MSTCYKNFPVVITYQDGSTENIYANDISLSESVAIESLESLGAKGSTAAFNRQAPEGSVSITSYMGSGISQTLDLIRENYQNITIKFGKYETPAPCILSSVSVQVSVGEPLTLSRDYQYFGSVTTGSTPAVEPVAITPVVPEGISISGYDNISGSPIITDVAWQVSQNYETFNLLGNVTPVVVYKSAEKTMDINGEQLTQSLMTSASAGCVVPPKPYLITISGCGTGLGTLGITGYMVSRSSSVTPGQVENNGVNITEFL